MKTFRQMELKKKLKIEKKNILWGAAKKVIFFSGPANNASSLVTTFFSDFKNSLFLLVTRPLLPPPLLVAGPLKKTFFSASLCDTERLIDFIYRKSVRKRDKERDNEIKKSAEREIYIKRKTTMICCSL